MNVNKVTLIGRICSDLTIRSTPTGQKVTNFRLAVNRSWTGKDGQKKEESDFFTVVFWGKLSEILEQYGKKGQLIYVMGRLANRSWEKNGEKRQSTEIVGETFQFGPKASNSAGKFSEDNNEVKVEDEQKPDETPF